MSDNIPFEVQVEIIKRLPVKSVVQFRSVSRAWKTLIDSSHFIVDYSGQHTQVQHLLIESYEYDHEYKQEFLSIVDDYTFPEQKVTLIIPRLVKMINYPKIIGSSHGLLCLYGYYLEGLGRPNSGEGMVALWNISISKVVAVVVPNVADVKGICRTVLGFGVCHETTDPKIIKITYIKSKRDIDSISCIPWQVEIFTPSTGAWRSPHSNHSLPRKSIKFEYYRRPVAVDGVLYWLASDRVNMDGGFRAHNLIILFHLTSEEFREVNLPVCLAHSQFRPLYMTKLKESLIVVECSGENSNQLFNVWMMEDGFPKSFTKLFTINSGENLIIPRGFRYTGELIIEVGKLLRAPAVYEPNSKQIYSLSVNGNGLPILVHSYVETLLLLDQPDFALYDKGKCYIAKPRGKKRWLLQHISKGKSDTDMTLCNKRLRN